MGDLNLPFEAQEPVPFTDLHFHVASGVVVIASVVDVGETPMPALVFRFAKPDGSGFYTATMLISEEGDLERLPDLIRDTVAGACNAARERRARRG